MQVTPSFFSGKGDDIVKQVFGSTAGFTLVLAGLKVFWEHRIRFQLVADRFPGDLE